MAASSLSLLVVDDCPDLGRFIQQCLAKAGHQAACVENGRDAIRFLQANRVDGLVTDVVMPDGDGLELISYTRRHHPATRILAISAGGQMLHAEYCLLTAERLGAHAVLRKPFGRPELLDAIELMRTVVQPVPVGTELLRRSKAARWPHASGQLPAVNLQSKQA